MTVLLAAASGWWGAFITLQPPDVPEPVASPAIYTVRDGTVSRALTFAAAASWEQAPIAAAGADGVITRVEHRPGSIARAGHVLYAVDERPVVAAEGAVPMYRELQAGAQGEDVAQLQSLLTVLTHYSGPENGRFDSGTTMAVRAWQRSLGVQPDGHVRRGDIVFLPALPARLALAETLVAGRAVSVGADAVLAVSQEPDFVIRLSQEQRDLVPLTAEVIVRHSDGEWAGRIASVETDTQGMLALTLEAHGGGPVCRQACDLAVPVGVDSHYPVDIIVVPETHGTLVPAAALRAGPGGEVSVTMASGEQRDVRIRASAAGQAIVDGLDPGDEILLFGALDRPIGPDDPQVTERGP